MGETTRGGAKRLGGKRPGRKRLGGETTRGGNGLGAKRLGFVGTWMRVRLESKSRRFDPHCGQHSFMESDHEIYSKVILSLLLIQEVSGKRMCTVLTTG